MAIPANYTEPSFSLFLQSQLGRIAAELGWVDGGGVDVGSYGEVINETLLACGLVAIEDAADPAAIRQLRTVGRYFAWRAAVEALATEHDLAADGASLSRSAVFNQAKQMLGLAEAEAAVHGIGPQAGTYIVGVTAVTRSDPYA